MTSYDELEKDKYGEAIKSKHAGTHTTCTCCREKVENWDRWSGNMHPPDNWGTHTDIGHLCKKCYIRYNKMLKDFVHKDSLNELEKGGYLNVNKNSS